MKTGHFPDLLLGHQNGQRNEATQCVNESGIQNSHPRGQVPQKVAKRDFEQRSRRSQREESRSPRFTIGAVKDRGHGSEPAPLFEVFAISLFKNLSSPPPV